MVDNDFKNGELTLCCSFFLSIGSPPKSTYFGFLSGPVPSRIFRSDGNVPYLHCPGGEPQSPRRPLSPRNVAGASEFEISFNFNELKLK